MKQTLLKKLFWTGTTAFLLLLSGSSLNAQLLPPYRWATQGGATGNQMENGQGVTADASGNVYTTGQFFGTAPFGSTTLTSAGFEDMFITKHDAAGNFLWAFGIGGTSSDLGYDIKLDGNGNLYITGRYSGTVDFDPGPAVFNMTSSGNGDIFILKLDVNGNFIWARSAGASTYSDAGIGIAVDAAGNSYTTGLFSGTADFDPGAGVFNLTAAGNEEIFVLKLDASGSFAWAVRIGNTSEDEGWAITADAAGNSYSTGIFNGTVDFNPGAGTFNLTSAGQRDLYLLKLDPNGNFVWATRTGGAGDELARDITLDASGNVYASGSTASNIYFTKLNNSGTTLWSRTLGAGQAYGIKVDNTGNVYTAGFFSGTVDFDPGAGTVNLTSAGSNDIFVSKLDGSGNYVDAYRMGGTGADHGYSIHIDASGSSAYLTGSFAGTADFDPGPGTASLTTTGAYQIYTLQLSPTAAPVILTSFDAYQKGAAVLLGWSTASEQNNKGFAIERKTENGNWSTIGYVSSHASNGTSDHSLVYNYKDPEPAVGVNFYRLQQEDRDGKIKYSHIQHIVFKSYTGGIKIFPNPAKNSVYVTGLHDNGTLSVFDVAGVLIYIQQLNTTSLKHTVSLAGLPGGIYHLKVSEKNGSITTFKLMLQ